MHIERHRHFIVGRDWVYVIRSKSGGATMARRGAINAAIVDYVRRQTAEQRGKHRAGF